MFLEMQEFDFAQIHGRNQGGAKGANPPPLSQVKVEKKIRNFNF